MNLPDFVTAIGIAPPHLASLAPPQTIINEARNGRVCIIVDDEGRKTLSVSAQMATPDVIGFMLTHGRGPICLAMPRALAESLDLDLTSCSDAMQDKIPFAACDQMRDDLASGISASDRARVIAAVINGGKNADALASPDCVLPLVARDGGVLAHTGHAEAAVDVARLAGLVPASVICELMNEDSTTAQRDEPLPFAQRHTLKIGTIRDLISYRLRHDPLVELRSETALNSKWGGDWNVMTFWNRATRSEHVVLVKGPIDPAIPTSVKMHMFCPFEDLLGGVGRRNTSLRSAMDTIAAAGSGVIMIVNASQLDSLSLILDTTSGKSPQGMNELRDCSPEFMILAALGVRNLHMLSNSNSALPDHDPDRFPAVANTRPKPPRATGAWRT